MNAEHLHQIGEVAERVELSLRTVRYYEEQGLVRPVQRTEGGFRLYSDEEIARLLLIKQMKPLGFTVQEMRDLLDARDRLASGELGTRAHSEALDRLAGFAEATKQKISELHGTLAAAEKFAGELGSELRRHRRRNKSSSPA